MSNIQYKTYVTQEDITSLTQEELNNNLDLYISHCASTKSKLAIMSIWCYYGKTQSINVNNNNLYYNSNDVVDKCRYWCKKKGLIIQPIINTDEAITIAIVHNQYDQFTFFARNATITLEHLEQCIIYKRNKMCKYLILNCCYVIAKTLLKLAILTDRYQVQEYVYAKYIKYLCKDDDALYWCYINDSQKTMDLFMKWCRLEPFTYKMQCENIDQERFSRTDNMHLFDKYSDIKKICNRIYVDCRYNISKKSKNLINEKRLSRSVSSLF